MNMFTLSKNFFTSFFSYFAFSKKEKQKKKKNFVETIAIFRALLDYNLRVAK